MRQVVSGTQTNAGTGAEAPVVTTTADGVPSNPAAQSAAPPLQQAALAAGGAAQVQHRLSGRVTTLSINVSIQSWVQDSLSTHLV